MTNANRPPYESDDELRPTLIRDFVHLTAFFNELHLYRYGKIENLPVYIPIEF
jgi:hypothetical protein